MALRMRQSLAEFEEAARQIGDNYLHFVKVYEESEATAAAR